MIPAYPGLKLLIDLTVRAPARLRSDQRPIRGPPGWMNGRNDCLGAPDNHVDRAYAELNTAALFPQPVGLEFVVRLPSGAGPAPDSERPNAHGRVRHGRWGFLR